MTTTLIDNATVSSVQRALGKAQLRDIGILDVEHASLDRFVEAILFTENVVVPDNYKEQFTPARKALLSKLNVSFLQIDAPIDSSLNEVASSLTGPWHEAFTEGTDRTLFNRFFNQVQAYSSFIWEHSSSEFFLVFRAHGVGKESPLIEALLASPKDDELGKQLRIVAKDGQDVDWKKLSRHVQRMLGVMGWLGHQYIWHQVLAARYDLTYSPHPLREFFANDFINRVSFGGESANQFKNAFREGMQSFQGKLQQNLTNLGALASSTSVQMPPLLPAMVRDSDSADDFISILGQLRNDEKVVEIRQTLAHMQKECDQGQFAKRASFIADMERIGENLLAERGLDRRILKIKPPTTITGISIEGDDTGIKLPIPSFLYRQYFLNKRYRAFLRDVMADLAAPSKYGAIKTKLNSWAWLPEESGFAGTPFYLKDYRFPSKFHRPLTYHDED